MGMGRGGGREGRKYQKIVLPPSGGGRKYYIPPRAPRLSQGTAWVEVPENSTSAQGGGRKLYIPPALAGLLGSPMGGSTRILYFGPRPCASPWTTISQQRREEYSTSAPPSLPIPPPCPLAPFVPPAASSPPAAPPPSPARPPALPRVRPRLGRRQSRHPRLTRTEHRPSPPA